MLISTADGIANRFEERGIVVAVLAFFPKHDAVGRLSGKHRLSFYRKCAVVVNGIIGESPVGDHGGIGEWVAAPGKNIAVTQHGICLGDAAGAAVTRNPQNGL